MTQDFLMGQLRLIAIAVLAYCTGKGYFTAVDAGLFSQILTPLGVIAAPWIWSIYKNVNSKIVPGDAKIAPANSMIIAPETPHDATAPVGARASGTVVASLLAAFLLLAPHHAKAQTTSNPLGLNALMQSPLVKALQAWIVDDVSGAEKLSTQIANLQDPVGQVCWQQVAAMGAIVQAHPLPVSFKLASDLEAARLFMMAVKNICKNPQCTQMFADVSNQIGAFTPIPTGLSFTAICAKIP